MPESLLEQLVYRFNTPSTDALVILGSYARGTATQYSDVDVVRFSPLPSDGRSLIFQGILDQWLVIVTNLGFNAVEDIFTHPATATGYLAGLRTGQVLCQRNDYFTHLQERATQFQWDTPMQEKANRHASEELAGWAEDMCKGLAGLMTDDVGRLLNTCYASTWGVSHVVQVQRGILLTSSNDFFDMVNNTMGQDSKWVALRKTAFGLLHPDGTRPTLHDQVVASLHLYCETARLLQTILQPMDRPVITYAVELIEQRLQAPKPLKPIHLL